MLIELDRLPGVFSISHTTADLTYRFLPNDNMAYFEFAILGYAASTPEGLTVRSLGSIELR
jgi:hypothetical protein